MTSIVRTFRHYVLRKPSKPYEPKHAYKQQAVNARLTYKHPYSTGDHS